MYWRTQTLTCGKIQPKLFLGFNFHILLQNILFYYLETYLTYNTACDESTNLYCYSTDSILLYCNNGVATNCSCPTTIAASPSKCDWYLILLIGF